jgi:hypothetical protein
MALDRMFREMQAGGNRLVTGTSYEQLQNGALALTEFIYRPGKSPARL